MKCKLVLIRPPYSYAIYKNMYKEKLKVGRKQVFPPMALMQLGAYVKSAGIDVKIIDGEAENLSESEILHRVLAEHPDVAGVTFTTPESDSAIELLNTIKQADPKITTVAGGAHATHVPWDIAGRCQTDYIVVYEGEKAIRAICTADNEKITEYETNAMLLYENKNIDKSLSVSKILLGQSLNTQELEINRPLRDVASINMDYYKVSDPDVGLVLTDSVETARGCPYACTFCSSARSGLAMRSVENVLDELEEVVLLIKKKGQRPLIMFLDDTLTINRNRSVAIFEGILNRGLQLSFKAFTRANTIATKAGDAADLAFLRLMKRAGSQSVSFGVETGSEKLNTEMKKGVTLDDYRKAYHLLRKSGFEERRASFIVGNPYETVTTIKDSIKFALELKINRVGVNIMTPYPGTEVYNMAIRGQGIFFEEKAASFNAFRRWGNGIISTQELSAAALEYWQKRFLSEVYASGSNLKYSLSKMASGNLSYFYHRPTLYALKDKFMMPGNKIFPLPDHDSYDGSAYGREHITKSDCIQVLNSRYGTTFSRQLKKV